MDWAKIMGWLKQPSTLHGLGVLALGVAGGLSYYATSNPWVSIAAGLVAHVAVNLGVNDNTAGTKEVQQVVEDAVRAMVEGKVKETMPQLVPEILNAVAAITGARGPRVR